MNLKQNLKRLLSENSISKTKLGRATNVPPSTLGEWINGGTPRDLRKVKAVADYFKISVDDLCFGPLSKLPAPNPIVSYEEEINAGLFEVVLRRKRP